MSPLTHGLWQSNTLGGGCPQVTQRGYKWSPMPCFEGGRRCGNYLWEEGLMLGTGP